MQVTMDEDEGLNGVVEQSLGMASFASCTDDYMPSSLSASRTPTLTWTKTQRARHSPPL